MRTRTNSSDVAKLAGVSRTTVSLVLNEVPGVRIPQETRQRIVEAARDLNYVAHHSARSLATGKTGRISLVTNSRHVFLDETNYVSTTLAGVMNVTVHSGYDVILHGGPADAVAESRVRGIGHEMAKVLLGDVSDGALLLGRTAPDPLAEVLNRAGFPYVALSYHDSEIPYSVDCDNFGGGRLMIQHLGELGHRTVGVVYTPGTCYTEERLAGAVAEGEQREMTIHRFETGITGAELMDNVRRLGLTAMLFTHEKVGTELLGQMMASGLRIPEDLSVITFDSTHHSSEFDPPLTSIKQPLYDMGFLATKILMDLIEDQVVPRCDHRLPVTLDIRNSTARVPQ